MSDAELAEEREHILKAIKCVHARVPSQLSRFFSSREQPSRSAAAGRAALRRALECAAVGWEPPCATVGAARVVHQALPCYRAQAQARFDIGGGGADGDQPHGLCVEPAMARACSQHSVVWILQASPADAGPRVKKAKTTTTPVLQPSITSMFSPRVSPSWSSH